MKKILNGYKIVVIVVCLILSSVPYVFANDAISVSTWEQFDDVVTNITSDITLNLKNDITAPSFTNQSIYTISSDYNIVIESDNNSEIIMPTGYSLAFDAPVTLNGVEISAKTVRFYKDGVVRNSVISSTVASNSNFELSLFSGSFKAVNNNGGNVTFKPNGNIDVNTLTLAATGLIQIQEDSKYPVSEVSLNEENIVLTNGSYLWNSNGTRTTLGSLLIKINNSIGPIFTKIPDSSITNSTNNAATVTGTVDNGTATLNVACDKACTVAYTTDNGATYTRVDAVQADSGYNFVVPNYSEDMKFVVAVKGDANGDGAVTNSDVTRLKAIQNGKYQADVIAGLAADVNGDNSLTNSDATRLKAVLNGKASIAW